MRSMLQLNEGWFFLKEHPENLRSVPIDAKSVCLPHTWNGIDGQDGGNDYFRGTCCYAKKIQRSELSAGQRYFLEINGANSSADVYLNGVHLAHHDGGYSAWRVDLTEALQNENLLVIMVDNAPNETVYPQHADFSFYGGLYRSVNIIAVPETHFELLQYGHPGIHVTPAIEGQNAKVHIDAPAVNLQPGDQIRYRIVDDEGDVVAEQIGCSVFWIENVHLWDGKKDPYLYTAEAAILRGDTELDTVTTQFGCRSFVLDPERGFILNGREYPLHGVCRHQDRWQIGNALLPEHHREDMDLICELGANTIRLAHYQHDQYFYDLCDERGMIVWAEIPYISRHMSTGNENTVQQMQELIIQCYNHPSIVVWGLSNEITMAFSVVAIFGCILGLIVKNNFWPVVGANFIYNMGTLPTVYILGALIDAAKDEVEYKHGFRPEGMVSVAVIWCVLNLFTGMFAGVYETGLNMSGYQSALGAAQPESVANWLYFIRYVIPIAEYALIIVILYFMNLEEKLPGMQRAIRQRHKEAAEARGEVWVSPEELAEQEKAENARLAEEARIADLKEKCRKKGLDFDTENKKYLSKKMAKRK